MGRANPGIFLAIPGIALLVLGLLILFAPSLPAWFLAGTAMFLGVGMLAIAVFVSRSARFRAVQFREARAAARAVTRPRQRGINPEN